LAINLSIHQNLLDNPLFEINIVLRIFALLLLVNPVLGFALSLGEIELKSHLGEPLNAKVEITDSETALEADCFSVADAGDIQAFQKAYVALKQNNGNQQLTITTRQAITEPIVNLRVNFHCEPSIDREYVLLMDPAPLVSAETAIPEKVVGADKSASNLSNTNKSLSGKTKASSTKQQGNDESISSPSISEAEVAAADPSVKKQRAKNKRSKKKASVPSINDKLMEAYVGKQQTSSGIEPSATAKDSRNNPVSAAQSNTSKPFLTISGGNTSSGEYNTQPSLSLRLETQLDLNRPADVAPLSTTDAMDEMTVMANRLAHLEKQILSLQSRNLQLQTEAEKAKNEGFRLSPNQSKWLNNILIALGAIAALACIEWLRRKLLRDRLSKNEAIWFEDETEVVDTATTASTNSLSNVGTSIFGDSMFDNNLSSQGLASDTPSQADKGESDNILEHAEVFIAHGRPVLAIQLLQNHLEDSPTESPNVWLKLLSLLAKEGSESEYEATVNECNQFFNIKMPRFAEAANVDTSSIEDHPHIVDRLQGVWGSQFTIGFLDDLIYNQQAQPREGFERGTFEELFFLKQIAEILQSSNKLNQNSTIYRPENVQPALEKIAVNQTLFATANFAEESASLQIPPVSEVDLLLDIEETPQDTKVSAAESNPQANNTIVDSSEEFQVMEIDFPDAADSIEQDTTPVIDQMEELVFESDMAETLEFSQDELKVEPTKEKTNVIEFDWDLPKINKE